MLYRLKEDTVVLGGMRMDYAAFGKGERPLVILPGLTLRDVKGAGLGLALSYRRFARDYRVYVFDKAKDIKEGYTVSDMARDTADAMRALGISDACVLGVSLGGMVAQHLAITYPELVRRLVLAVTMPRPNPTAERVIGEWVACAERDDFATLIRGMFPLMYSEKYMRRYAFMMPLLSRIGAPRNKERFVRLARACLTSDTYEDLSRISCPTLVLGGREDKIVTADASLELARGIGCACHLYDGLGHAAYEEAADFNERVARHFLEA